MMPEPEDVRDPDRQTFRDEHQQERNTEERLDESND